MTDTMPDTAKPRHDPIEDEEVLEDEAVDAALKDAPAEPVNRSPAALRALAEAEERRKQAEADANQQREAEVGGVDGP
ncbi:MAG: hypothetical protein AAFO62_08925, partial [Pseudomonadota bacterium]